MKKLLLTTIFFIGIIFFVDAQITGGGEQQAPPPPPPDVPLVKAKDKPGFQNILFGYAGPNGGFSDDGGGAGAFFGYAGFIPAYKFMDGLEAGVKVGFDIQFNSLDLETETVNFPFGFMDILIGPSMDYQFAENIGVEGFFKLGPVIGFGPDYDVFVPSSNGFSSTVNVYNEGAAFGLGTGFGLNLNFSNFVLGLEINGGTLTYTLISDSSSEDIESDVAIGCTRISIGSRF
ncbi:MAG: hypothetical protein RLP13_10800 [Cytophagales bacterium]